MYSVRHYIKFKGNQFGLNYGFNKYKFTLDFNAIVQLE